MSIADSLGRIGSTFAGFFIPASDTGRVTYGPIGADLTLGGTRVSGFDLNELPPGFLNPGEVVPNPMFPNEPGLPGPPTKPAFPGPPVLIGEGPPIKIDPGYPNGYESSTQPFFTIPTFDGMQKVPLEISRPNMKGREVGPYRGKGSKKRIAPLIGILGRASGVIGGILWPSELGNSDLFDPGSLQRGVLRAIPTTRSGGGKRYTTKSKPSSPALPVLPGVKAAPIARAPIARPAPTPKFVPEPVIPGEFSYSLPMPSMPTVSVPRTAPTPKAAPKVPRASIIPQLLDLAQPILLALAQPKPKSPPSDSPSLAKLTDPLTPVITAGVPYPLAGGSFGFAGPSGGSMVDQCRDIRKRQKPKRKCVERDDCNRCIKFEAL